MKKDDDEDNENDDNENRCITKTCQIDGTLKFTTADARKRERERDRERERQTDRQTDIVAPTFLTSM